MREDERAMWTKLAADFESVDLSQRQVAQQAGAADRQPALLDLSLAQGAALGGHGRGRALR